MAKSKIVLINGQPGVGKTTLAAKLARDLPMPLMGKDMLKEFFFDQLEVTGREDSRVLGGAVSEMLYILAEAYLAADKTLILENAFYAEFARPRFSDLLEKYPAECLELYCFTDPMTRRQRFETRIASGERHSGHADTVNDHSDEELAERYAPLQIGNMIRVDTTHFGETEYDVLLTKIRALLEGVEPHAD